ncbi:MAG TPA: hypothetical protein VK657_01250, partial [Terriglobales bacterium]|nr:hypothetical protein [Terriglobales bacterium]
MPRKLTSIGVCLLALAPTAYFAWTFRAMPHLGFYHDDSIYWVSAESLAQGHGYKIASLPGEPYQTKYPPLYSALLAVIWKLNPEFPSNLPWATLFAWLLLPIYLSMVWALLRQYGFRPREQYLLTMVAALSPIAATFSVSLMPELLFTALLLASVILAERASSPQESLWVAILGGVCGALAFVTKSAAGPLILTAPLCFAVRKQYIKGALFLAPILAAVACWQWWVAAHLSSARDLVTLYYTNYLGFQTYNVPLRDLPLVAWHNLDAFLMGAGRLLTFDVAFGSKHLERVVAVAAIAGSIRLARRTRMWQYPVLALGMSAVLLVWHFPPDHRFIFPLYPLLVMGLWTELANVGRALKMSWRKPAFADRSAAFAGAAVLAGFGLFVVFTSLFGLFSFLPRLFSTYRTDFKARRPAYEWIARNAPPDANVYAYDDPLLFLYTGRKSCNLPIPTRFQYHDDQDGIDKLLHSMPDF